MTAASSTPTINQIVATIHVVSLLKAVFLIVLGFVLASRVSKWSAKLLRKHINSHQKMLVRRIIFYVIFILFLLSALQHLGFSLSILLGATGFLTVAIGFAAQTSVSNLISGLFLIVEKPFVVGDAIKLDSLTGEILSIDAMSIKLRTYQNTMVRIPNETLIKSNFINLSRFPIRRYDLQIGVGYSENLERVKQILLTIANDNTVCLKDPVAIVYFSSFGDSAINLQFSTWATQANYVTLQNTIPYEVKIAFEKEHIDMPYPIRTVIIENSNGATTEVATETGSNPIK